MSSNPALNTDALHAASRHVGRRLAPRYAFCSMQQQTLRHPIRSRRCEQVRMRRIPCSRSW